VVLSEGEQVVWSGNMLCRQIQYCLLCGSCTATKCMFGIVDALDDKPSGFAHDRETGLAFHCDFSG